MPITYNGVTIPTNADVIKYNGNDVDIVTYNGVTIWEKIKAYITFNKNAEAATGEMEQQAGGTGVVLNKNAFARTNCNFVGWNTASNATSALYSNGATVDISQDTTLYAVWEMKPLNISITPTFSAGEGVTKISQSSGTINYIFYNFTTYPTVYSQFFDCCEAKKILLTTQYQYASCIFEDSDGNSFSVTINTSKTIPTEFRNKKIRLVLGFYNISSDSGEISIGKSFRIDLAKR